MSRLRSFEVRQLLREVRRSLGRYEFDAVDTRDCLCKITEILESQYPNSEEEELGDE